MGPSRKKGVGFAAAIIALYIVGILLTTGSIGYVSFRYGQSAANDFVKEVQNSVQARVERMLKYLLSMPHSLNQMNATAIQTGLADARDLVSMRMRFLQQVKAFDSVMTCAFGAENGNFVGAGRKVDGGFDCAVADRSKDKDYRVYLLDEQGQPGGLVTVIKDYDVQGRPWYQTAVAAGRATWSPPYVWASQKDIGISAVLPVRDRAGALLGVQMSSMSLGHIGHFLQSIKVAKTGEIFIIERSGALVASSTLAPVLIEQQKDAQSVLQRVPATSSTNPLIRQTTVHLNETFKDIGKISAKQQLKLEVDGRGYFLSVTPFTEQYGLDWLIAIAIPESDLMDAVNANTRSTILVGLTILLVTLVAVIGLTRWITRPLLRLNKATQEMGRGRWVRIESDKAFREIRQLTDSFNWMADRLSESYETLERRIQERTVELLGTNEQLQEEIAERKRTEAEKEKLITELQQAMQNVKVLSGLLPICASCKKIRDDQGYWQDVAVYIRDRSEAEFSHGICPDCMAKLYPDLMREDS